MRYSVAAALLAATAMACDTCHYNGTVHYTTEVVSEYSTYCPYATHLSFNGVTYTVTEATTLVVTNCPCTITKPVPVTQATPVPVTPVYVSSVETPVVVSSVPVAPVSSVTPVSPPAVVTPPPVVPSFVNATTVLPTGTGSPAPPVSPSVEAFKGAGSRVAASGASLVAVLGLAAFFL